MEQLALFDRPLNQPPVQYWPGFFPATQADRFLAESLALEWQHNTITMLGKPQLLPRLETMFGDTEDFHYVYSKSVELRAQPWPPFLAEMRSRVEDQTGYRYQVVIGNQYRSGEDSIGYHADDEPTLGPTPAIASISLGATRVFRLKRKEKGSQSVSFRLGHGDLLLMLPGCQENWVHAIPKTTQCRTTRINWTFRPYKTQI